MAVIPPTKKGKTYWTWKLQALYINRPLSTTLSNNEEPGYRLSTINTCWAIIESFTRGCVDEIILTKYREIPFPQEFTFKLSIWQKIKNLFRKKSTIENEKFDQDLSLRDKFSDRIKRESWYPSDQAHLA